MDIVFHALSSNIPEGSGSTPSNHVGTALVCEENKKGPSSNFDLISNQILITNVSTIFKVLNQLVLEKKGGSNMLIGLLFAIPNSRKPVSFLIARKWLGYIVSLSHCKRETCADSSYATAGIQSLRVQQTTSQGFTVVLHMPIFAGFRVPAFRRQPKVVLEQLGNSSAINVSYQLPLEGACDI